MTTYHSRSFSPKSNNMTPKAITFFLLASLVQVHCSGFLPAPIAYTRAIPYNIPPFAAAVSFLRTGPKAVIAPPAALLPPHLHARYSPVVPNLHDAPAFYPGLGGNLHHSGVVPHAHAVPFAVPHAHVQAVPLPHPHAHAFAHAVPLGIPHGNIAQGVYPHFAPAVLPQVLPHSHVTPIAQPVPHVQALPHAHAHPQFAPLIAPHAHGHAHVDTINYHHR